MIKKIIVLLIICTAFIPNKIHPHAEELVKQEQMTPQELVTYYAKQYGVNQELAHYIAENESHYVANEKGDLNITCNAKNSPYYGSAVYARGIYQITRCYHPDVSDDQAFDADYNVQYAMQILAKGKSSCMREFSTCRDYYHSTN